MGVIAGAFRRNVSKSRKCVVNGASRNGRWPMPSVRNGCPPFGPKNKKIIEKMKNILANLFNSVFSFYFTFIIAERLFL